MMVVGGPWHGAGVSLSCPNCLCPLERSLLVYVEVEGPLWVTSPSQASWLSLHMHIGLRCQGRCVSGLQGHD